MDFPIPEYPKVDIEHILNKNTNKSKYTDREIFTLPNTLILIAYVSTQRPQLGNNNKIRIS